MDEITRGLKLNNQLYINQIGCTMFRFLKPLTTIYLQDLIDWITLQYVNKMMNARFLKTQFLENFFWRFVAGGD